MALTRDRARRLCVLGQMLSGPRPRTIEEVVRGLGEVQMDPTSAVARTEHLVLFSRLGRRFRVAGLERRLWEDRVLFEYRAHIVPTSDFAIHREAMRRYPRRDLVRHRYVRDWLTANGSFRRYVLSELRRRGPLRTRDLEDRTVHGWRTGGWNDDGKNTAMMLEILWARGEVMIAGRDGQQRVWDLAARRLPLHEPRPPSGEVTRRILVGQLRARGVAKPSQFGWALDGLRPPGWERVLSELVREGVAVPATIDGLNGEWYAHADLLGRPFRPRTVLLSPFDDLVSDRAHTEALFGFRFRLEIYVPKAKREFGYFVMPVLRGNRLIGRIDPRYDRAAGILHVDAVHAEGDASDEMGADVRGAIDELAAWLGADHVTFGPALPPRWRRSLVA
jgi:uncharacterized protein YcaQ